jgi:hypothetical protein
VVLPAVSPVASGSFAVFAAQDDTPVHSASMKKLAALLFFVATVVVAQQQPNDDEYTAQIKKFTTGPQFVTELVDHLPASESVPTPLKFNGYIAGADGHLTYTADVARYFRALEASSKRIKVLPIGKSEEGREMIVAVISSDGTIANLDRYIDITRRLSDPRALTDADAEKLIESGKPIYYLTGTIHSPETGSPEMLMELAYRLIVEESPKIRSIRDNAIVMITPVIEVDGHDRQVDLWRYRQANPNVPTPPLVYWGHYVAHDNNRDNLGLTLALSRNVLQTVLQFHPTVMHDLHESVPFMYVMSGTGPFNPSLDPIMIDEWHRMAYHDVDEMTRRGVPGVWLHGFYDGWATNYMLWAGTGHNAIGRFYETFGNRWPITADRVVRNNSDRQWFRPNPPLPQVKWSFRNNINYQQSGVLFSLIDMAENRRHFLENFYAIGKRAVAKASNEGPAAWVFDGTQKRQNNLRDLMALLVQHGIEVHVADAPFTLKTNWPPPRPLPPAEAKSEPSDKPVTFAKNSFIVRMDQPYSRLADAILDVQYVRGDEKVYDDTGWTLGYLKNVDFKRVVNQDVLKVPMHRWTAEKDTSSPRVMINSAETEFARALFAAKNPRISDEETTIDGRKVPAGSLIGDAAIVVKAHEWKSPRIALLHTWQRTQDEGWYRMALDSLGIPYTYLSTQQVATIPNLRDRFDVILFPPTGGLSPQDIVNGMPPGPPLPWKKTELTPNLGLIDRTDDMRPGLGLTGIDRLTSFVENGGLLITAEDTSEFAVQYGLARWVRTIQPRALKSPGTIVAASVTDKKSPIAAGYDDTLPIYFSGSPIFQVGQSQDRQTESRPSGRGGKDDPDVAQGHAYVPLPEKPKPAPGEEGFQKPEDAPWNAEHLMVRPEDRPRVVVSFAKPADKLLMSGMLEGGDEIAGKPAVIDSPRGRGHILLFANNPMWRGNTQGNYALVTNAIVNWDRLR